MRRKKRTDQYTEEKTWVFSFDLKEESEDDELHKSTVRWMSTVTYVLCVPVNQKDSNLCSLCSSQSKRQ